jgi:hypothetical protein
MSAGRIFSPLVDVCRIPLSVNRLNRSRHLNTPCTERFCALTVIGVGKCGDSYDGLMNMLMREYAQQSGG